jgi:hypothetical protein
MKVKLLTYYANSERSADIDEIIDVDEDEAAALIEGKFAEMVVVDVPEDAIQTEVEKNDEIQEKIEDASEEDANEDQKPAKRRGRPPKQ